VSPEIFYRFLYPWVLIGMPLPFVLLWLEWRRPHPTHLFSDLGFLAGMPVGWRVRAAQLLPWTRAFALCLGIFAMARPQLGTIEYNATTLGVDIALVMDVSGSMQERDFNPNRLEASKEAAVKFIQSRKSDRITVVVFSEKAATLCPPTTDLAAAQMFVESITDGMIPNQSTAVGDGLALAVSKLKDSPAKSRVAVLLTDGESNSGSLKPDQAAEIARSLGVKVYTISVGSNAGGTMDIFGRQAQGQAAQPQLQRIAEVTGGKYYTAANERKLREVYDDIDRLEKTEMQVNETADFSEKFMFFWYPALALLAIELLLRAFVLRRLP